jgi:hypothetical protein
MGSSILPRHHRASLRSTVASVALDSYVNQYFRAQRNAIESPLLRLPPEVRNVIWTFAVGVDLVFIRQKSKRPLRAKGYGVAFDGQIRRFEDDRQLAAFHLPEVCRQIYAETATLAYSTNTFLPCGAEWIRALSLTQRRAISRVELIGFQDYLYDYERRRSAVSLKKQGSRQTYTLSRLDLRTGIGQDKPIWEMSETLEKSPIMGSSHHRRGEISRRSAYGG